MDREHQIVVDKAKKRFEVLKALYLSTEGKTIKTSTSGEISKETGIPNEELVHILQYLKDEGLIHPLAMLYGGESLTPIQILHKGVLEVEAAISKPSEPTEHFPAQVVNITNNAPVSAQQFGNQNTLNISQQSSLAQAVNEIQNLLKQLEQANPTATEAEKVEYINDETTPGFKRRVNAALQSSGEAAIDEFILENKYLKVVKAAVKGWLKPNV